MPHASFRILPDDFGVDEYMNETLLEAVRGSLAAAARHAPGEVAPAVVLWPDADAQWLPLIPQLRNLMPQLIVLGTYDPGQRQGPAIWVRCVIERVLPEVPLPERVVPVIYMPNVSRQTLRAIEECPGHLKPMVELQYRGTVWCQRNGKDWTVDAFLASEDAGLQLDVAKDNHTRAALLGALAQLGVTPLTRLLGKRLEAEDFDKLMIEDTPRNLLEWMCEPRSTREKWDAAGGGRWTAFGSRCRAEYGFDPEKDGEVVAGERLGMREGAWLGVWERFAESPALYAGLPHLLRRAKPTGLLFVKETWPDENDDAEVTLRKGLQQLAEVNATQGRDKILVMEKEHAIRRHWVWAKLGLSPLARALAHLAALAAYTTVSIGGDSPEAMADLYAHGGYLADDAVLRALAEVRSAEDHSAVAGAIRAMYLPWVQDAAEHLQKLVASNPLPGKGSGGQEDVSVEAGTCILFVDGLRLDVGQRLAGLAKDREIRVVHGRRWAALPTVTGTAKPAVTPVAKQIVGHHLGDTFVPDLEATGQPMTQDRLRKLLETGGYQCLSAAEVGRPQDPSPRAWTEYGQFDRLGHDLQAKLASRIEEQLELVMERIEGLLTAGWRQVRVVTDHGWQLVPGGLPTMTLAKFLTGSRWSRCATVKAGAQVSVPTAGWYWNPTELFAFGAGVRCFSEGNQYAHGGISVQECVIPDMVFMLDFAPPSVTASIGDVQWLGLRCRVSVQPADALVSADVRTKVGEAGSSIVAVKPIDKEGRVGLLVEDDSLLGTTVSVVLLDISGRVIAKRATIVGGEE